MKNYSLLKIIDLFHLFLPHMGTSCFLSYKSPKISKTWACSIKTKYWNSVLSGFVVNKNISHCFSCRINMAYKLLIKWCNVYRYSIIWKVRFFLFTVHFYWLKWNNWSNDLNQLDMTLCLTFHLQTKVFRIRKQYFLIYLYDLT